MVLDTIDGKTNSLKLTTRINKCFSVDNSNLQEDYINIYVEIMQLLKELAECPKEYYLDSDELSLKIPGISLFPMGEADEIFDNLIKQLNTRYNETEDDKVLVYLTNLYKYWLKCLQKPNEGDHEKMRSFISVLGIKTYIKEIPEQEIPEQEIPEQEILQEQLDIKEVVTVIIGILKSIKLKIEPYIIGEREKFSPNNELFENQDKEQKKAELLEKKTFAERQSQMIRAEYLKIIKAETDLDYLLDLCIVENKFNLGIYKKIVDFKNAHLKTEEEKPRQAEEKTPEQIKAELRTKPTYNFLTEYPEDITKTNDEGTLLKIIKLYRDLKAKNVNLSEPAFLSISGPAPSMSVSYSYSEYSSLKYFQPLIGLIRLLSNIIEERSKFKGAEANIIETIKGHLQKIANVEALGGEAKDKAISDAETEANAAAKSILSYYKKAADNIEILVPQNKNLKELLETLNLKKKYFGLEFNEDYYIAPAQYYNELLGILEKLKDREIWEEIKTLEEKVEAEKAKVEEAEKAKAKGAGAGAGAEVDQTDLKAAKEALDESKTILYDIVNPYIELYNKKEGTINFYEIDDYMESLEYYYGLWKQELKNQIMASSKQFIADMTGGKTPEETLPEEIQIKMKQWGNRGKKRVKEKLNQEIVAFIDSFDIFKIEISIQNIKKCIEKKKEIKGLSDVVDMYTAELGKVPTHVGAEKIEEIKQSIEAKTTEIKAIEKNISQFDSDLQAPTKVIEINLPSKKIKIEASLLKDISKLLNKLIQAISNSSIYNYSGGKISDYTAPDEAAAAAKNAKKAATAKNEA